MKGRYTWIQRLLASIFWRFPLHVRRYLKFRGVYDRTQAPVLLNEEFKEEVASPELGARLARKR